MAANAAAWIAFMLTPPVPADVFAAIDAERRAPVEGMGPDLFFHRPTHLAGRYIGIGGPINEADRVLDLFAGPAIDFARYAHFHLVPLGRRLTEPTRGESYAIAAVAFVLSMAFWNAFGATVQFWRARRRRRAKVLDPSASIPHRSFDP